MKISAGELAAVMAADMARGKGRGPGSEAAARHRLLSLVRPGGPALVADARPLFYRLPEVLAPGVVERLYGLVQA